MTPRLLASVVAVAVLLVCGHVPSPARASADSVHETPFTRTLQLHGIGFHVSADNASPVGTVTIAPTGLDIDNAPVTRNITGRIRGAEVADLDADGSPEIYVYATSDGSGSYGSLVAYAANKRKSLSEIYLPPINQNSQAAIGYMGHDQFAVGEGRLLRRFPIYREHDTNATPAGGVRQLQYRLQHGEAGWVLVMDRIVEF